MKTPPKKQPKNEKKRLQELVKFETKAYKLGFKHIAGVDEAGRGPLAGPVVAAACIISKGILFEGINDSKLLAPRKRKELFEKIITHPQVSYGIGVVNAAIIDQINIFQATIKAMLLALEDLPFIPDYLLVDAISLSYLELPCEKIIKGDRLSHSIAAASIVAKQSRDALMVEYHKKFPEYGFNEHKGYGTKKHKEALEKYGPSSCHRFSFEPLKSLY